MNLYHGDRLEKSESYYDSVVDEVFVMFCSVILQTVTMKVSTINLNG